MGRWINRDPAEEIGSLNNYFFLNNNPISQLDYLGLYGKEIHYRLTLFLSIKAGFCEKEAKKIAEMDQSVDEGETNPILRGIEYNLFRTEGSEAAMRHHFSIDPNDPNNLTVIRNSAYVNGLVDMQIKEGNHLEFGRALHPYQDSWSHERYTLIGHGADGTTPDKTNIEYRWIGRDLEMAMWTFFKLKLFLKENPDFCRCNDPAPFPEDIVIQYLKSDEQNWKEKLLQ